MTATATPTLRQVLGGPSFQALRPRACSSGKPRLHAPPTAQRTASLASWLAAPAFPRSPSTLSPGLACPLARCSVAAGACAHADPLSLSHCSRQDTSTSWFSTLGLTSALAKLAAPRPALPRAHAWTASSESLAAPAPHPPRPPTWQGDVSGQENRAPPSV